MSTALNIINEWAVDSEEKQKTVKTRSGLVLRWLNQAQLRYVEKAQCLRSVWLPSVPSSGNIVLPADFLYEFPDRIKRNANNITDIFLVKMEYPVADARYHVGLYFYSIYNGTFYVWAKMAATPSVPYVRKPTVLTSYSSDLEIPTEFQGNLIPYVEAKWLYSKKEITYPQLLQMQSAFDLQANNDGLTFRTRNDKIPSTRGSWF
jgi:hypothetical protein